MANTDSNHCLLIGQSEGILAEGGFSCRVAETFADGLILAANHRFNSIYVVFSCIREPRSSALRDLYQVSPESLIVILADMYEEPDVLETIRLSGLQELNYLICPLKPEELSFSAGQKNRPFLSEKSKDRRIQELEVLVLQDDLTGLKNRRYLRLFLPAIIRQAELHGFQVTLLLFDIDDFKHYNDAYGHSVGDRVLRQTASLIRRCCRTQDIVARLGGDEFAVVFWDRSCTKTVSQTETSEEKERRACRDHPREAFFMADRFRREMLAASFDLLGPKGKGSLTISGGLATYPKDATTAEILFEKADQAMLEAKRSGKNRLYLVGRPDLSSHE